MALGTTSETAYYVLSTPLSAKRFNEVVRSHWDIESRLHWRLDVVMNEDQARNRADNGPYNLAVLRPITLLARQRGWSRGETARAAFQAGVGHVGTTLLLGLIVWLAGVAVEARFGHIVDTLTSLALISFGGWIAIAAWRELHAGHGHSHGGGHSAGHVFSFLSGEHAHGASDPVHGPEQQGCNGSISARSSGMAR